MLHVWWPSGEEAACVSISHADRVQQLKQRLHMLLRVSRFLQRIVHGNVILDDDAQLASITDAQLVVLPFLSTSEQGANNFLRAVRENSHFLVMNMLQMQHDPNTAAHSRNEHLTPIEAAAKEGHTGMVSLLLEAGAQDAFDADQVALAAASRAGHREVVSLLLEAGGDRDCALQAASWAGQVQIVHLLLERPGAYELTARGYRESLVAASATLNQGILITLANYYLECLAPCEREDTLLPKLYPLYKRRDYDGFCALLHVFAARAVWPEEIAVNDWVGSASDGDLLPLCSPISPDAGPNLCEPAMPLLPLRRASLGGLTVPRAR
ncbi:ANKRD50, partial [Symbiodinium necroappetens]